MNAPLKKTLTIILLSALIPTNLGLALIGLSRARSSRDLVSRTEEIVPLSHHGLPSHIYASLPASSGQVMGTATAADARAVIIEKYLEKYRSTMTPYDEVAKTIVTVSDDLGLDWRLLVAIAQQESNLGKKMPEGCNNAWGYGIHSRGTLCFESWKEGIETVGRGLKKKYLDQGLTTPEEIMAKYTPHSDGSWAFGVNQFLEDLQLGKID